MECRLLYGIAGSTNLGEIGSKVATVTGLVSDPSGASSGLRPMLLLANDFTGGRFVFKIAAVPFHMWAPDVYEGAPTSVTAFLSTGSKAASFVLYIRIFSEALRSMHADWAPLLGLVAAITIMVGNWAAVTQENSKRLLAYSSISNAGYLLLGLIAGNEYGYIGLVVYLLVYTLMNMGAFGVIISLRRRGIIGDNVDDLTGLGQKSPGVAGDDGTLHVIARWPAYDWRICWQVLFCLAVCCSGRTGPQKLVLLACSLGDHQYRRVLLLLR
jgi:NADH-quinone oxidoreductase subunit N